MSDRHYFLVLPKAKNKAHEIRYIYMMCREQNCILFCFDTDLLMFNIEIVSPP